MVNVGVDLSRIHQALQAHHHEGRFYRGSQYLTADEQRRITGYVLKAMRTEQGIVYTVDHAGKGVKQALLAYAHTLQAQGFSAHIARHPYRSKDVVYVEHDELPKHNL